MICGLMNCLHYGLQNQTLHLKKQQHRGRPAHRQFFATKNSIRGIKTTHYSSSPVYAVNMKTSPNDSTSKAKKYQNPLRCRARSATELRFGLVHVQTHVRTQLRPILKISIFSGPSRSLLVGISTLQHQEFSEIYCSLFGVSLFFCWSVFDNFGTVGKRRFVRSF